MTKRILFFALFLGCFVPVFPQVQVAPFVTPNWQFFDNSGAPCAGCSVTFFAAGTSTPLNTYSDSAGSTPNSNPVVLNSAGRPSSGAIFLSSAAYKIVLKDASGNTLTTTDNVTWNNLATSLSSLTVTAGDAVVQSNGASSGNNQNSPNLNLCGSFFPGVNAQSDCWSFQDVVGTGTTPTSTLTLRHSGSGGTVSVNFPSLTFSNLTVSGALNVSGTSTLAGVTATSLTNTGAETITSPGSFSNTNIINHLSMNVGTLDIGSEIVTGQGTGTMEGGITCGIKIPNTSTTFIPTCIQAFLTNSATSNNAVGLYVQSRNLVSNGITFGANFQMMDAAANTGHTLNGLENTFVIQGTPSTVTGMYNVLASPNTNGVIAGTTSFACTVNTLSSHTPEWQYCLRTAAGASQIALDVGKASASGATASQFIALEANSDGSTPLQALIQEAQAGGITLSPGASGQPVAITGGGKLQQNGATSGTITVKPPDVAGTNTQTWQAATGTVADIDVAQTWGAVNQTSMQLVTPKIGGTTITNVPEMTFTGFQASLNGIVSFAAFTPSSAITITRLQVEQITGSTGCGTFPVVSVFDNSGSSVLTSVTESASTNIDSGALSVAVTAGHQLFLRVTTAGVTCSPTAANVMVTMQYKMQ